MAHNVQFRKIWINNWAPNTADPHIFYAVYETWQEGVGFSNLKAFYLGNIELSDTALAATVAQLDEKVAQEILDARAAEKANADAIAAEADRAKAAEKVNADAVTAEADRAKAAEAGLQTAIATEEARAKAAEKANSDKIDSDIAKLKSEIGNLANVMNFKGGVAILPDPNAEGYELGDVVVGEAGGDPSIAGKEYVLTEKDGVRQWVEIGYTGATDAALAELKGRVDVAEGKINTLESEMDSVEARATDLETRATKLEGDLAAEVARATGAEATLNAALTSEADRAKAEEARIVGLVEAEAARADAEEKRIVGLVNAEADRAKGAEGQLDTRITTVKGELETKVNTDFATLRGGADASVTIGKLVGAINQLVDGTANQESTLKDVTNNVSDLNNRVVAAENLLTWQE